MMHAMPQPQKPPSRPDSIQWRRHRWLAVGLVAAGGVLLAGNLGVLPAGLVQIGQWAVPLLAVAVGLWLVARAPKTAPIPSFAVERSNYQAARLVVSAGLSHVDVRGFAGTSQMVVGVFPAPGGPGFSARDGQARVELSGRHAWPLLPARRWSAELAKGLPWTLDLRTATGDLDLDLRDLSVNEARVRTTFGDVSVQLPAAGQVELDLRLLAGDLHLKAPDGMAVKLKVRAGPLAAVRPDQRRFVQLAPGEWASPLYAVSADRCTVNVHVWAGDLDLE